MAYSVDLDKLSFSAPLRDQCEDHGSFLENAPFSPVKSWWFEDVDKALASLGVDAVRMDDLWMGEESGSTWSTQEVQRAAEQAQRVTDEQVQALEDRYLSEAVDTALEWIRTAAARNEGIVGFYH